MASGVELGKGIDIPAVALAQEFSDNCRLTHPEDVYNDSCNVKKILIYLCGPIRKSIA